MTPVFQSSGLRVGNRNYPGLALAPGEVGGWRGAGRADCAAIFDMVTGLAPVPPGGAVWFGRDLAGEKPGRILAAMRRIAPLTHDGGLIGNLTISENILLPFLQRGIGRERDGLASLAQLAGSSPPGVFLGRDNLRKLPHQIDHDDLPLAAVLRAALLRPEAVAVCDIERSLGTGARERLAESLAWLRELMPDAAWVFVQSESALPGGIEGNIVGPQP